MLTLDECERLAYAAGDTRLTALLYQTEDEFAEVISLEHEAVIDDRNRLRDALTECLERMNDAIEQLDTFNTSEPEFDIVTGDPVCLNLAPEFGDAIDEGRTALLQCEPQDHTTTAEKLATANATIADLRAMNAKQAYDASRAAAVLADAQALTREYHRTAKPAPKWAQRLMRTLSNAQESAR